MDKFLRTLSCAATMVFVFATAFCFTSDVQAWSLMGGYEPTPELLAAKACGGDMNCGQKKCEDDKKQACVKGTDNNCGCVDRPSPTPSTAPTANPSASATASASATPSSSGYPSATPMMTP
jgi:hypothetical protein